MKKLLIFILLFMGCSSNPVSSHHRFEDVNENGIWDEGEPGTQWESQCEWWEFWCEKPIFDPDRPLPDN